MTPTKAEHIHTTDTSLKDMIGKIAFLVAAYAAGLVFGMDMQGMGEQNPMAMMAMMGGQQGGDVGGAEACPDGNCGGGQQNPMMGMGGGMGGSMGGGMGGGMDVGGAEADPYSGGQAGGMANPMAAAAAMAGGMGGGQDVGGAEAYNPYMAQQHPYQQHY